MAVLKQNTAYTRAFLMVSSSDHISGLTGATVTVTLSKAGGAFAAAGGTVTEISSGWYKIALTTTDTNTLGDLAFHCTATGGDPTDFADQVAGNILGDTLPANVTQISGAAVSTTTAQLGVNVVNFGGTAVTGRDIGASVLLSNGTGTGQISLASGAVTVGTNNDKTGYSLTQAFPTNFALLSIDGNGRVDLSKWNGTALNGSVPPDATFIRSGTAQAGGASTITLDSGASATNNFYQNEIIFLRSGTGAGQAAIIASYVGATKVATINGTWATNPDSTSVFTILPMGSIPATVSGSVTVGGYSAGEDPATLVWGAARSSFTTSGSFGQGVASVQGNVTGSVGSVTGAVGSVTGAVGSVTGNVGGNVVGSVASVSGSVGSIAGVTFPGNFGSLGISAGGHISNVDTLTTYTGNTPQTGDAYARIGAAGVGLTNLGDTRIANLDATVSSRATAAQILTTALTESYSVLHAAPTLTQIIFEMRGLLAEKAVTGTTLTVNKIDGSTSAETFALNDSVSPTAITRAS